MKYSMTKRRIEEYASLRREIVMLGEQVDTAQRYGMEYLWDVVQASTGPGDQKRNIVVKGYGSRSIPKLLALKAKKETECDAIEKYIEEVDDSVIRQILTRRYIEGRSIYESAQLVGYSERQVKRIIKGFFERMSTNSL